MPVPASALAVARALVDGGVAPDAAVGWAAPSAEGGWEVVTAASSPGSDPFFDLASVTKPMLAAAVARSALARDALMGEALPAAEGTRSARLPIELFLAHRAGLEAHVAFHERRPFAREDVLRAAADARRPDATGPAPAGGFAPLYSDLGYILAGEALARAERAGDAGEVIERLVVGPLGCPDALGTARSLRAREVGFSRRVRPTEVVPSRGGEIRGAVHDDNAWALTGEGGSGHAGLFGTAQAVLRFGCAVLDALHGRGPLAGPSLDWLVAPRPGGTLRAGFDGKSEVGSSAGERAGPRTFGHLGFTGTSVWIDPDASTVVAVLTNRVHPTRDNLAIRAARPAAHDALFDLAAHASRLAPRAGGHTIG